MHRPGDGGAVRSVVAGWMAGQGATWCRRPPENWAAWEPGDRTAAGSRGCGQARIRGELPWGACRADVLQNDLPPAGVWRHAVSAAANVPSRDTGKPGGVTSGVVPERHHEHTPAAGLTGGTLSARGAHGRSRWDVPPRHGVSSANTADLEVNAWCGGEGSRPPAPQSWWASRRSGRERGRSRHDHQDDGHGPDTRAPGHGGQGHRTVFRRPSRGAAASWRRSSAVSGTAPGGDCTHQDRVLNAHGSAGSTCSDNGMRERLKGLRFDARCVRVASWTVPKRFQRSLRRAALQSGRCVRHRSGPARVVRKTADWSAVSRRASVHPGRQRLVDAPLVPNLVSGKADRCSEDAQRMLFRASWTGWAG